MKLLGFVFLTLIFATYALLVKTIWQLVDESRKVDVTTRFNRFWWIPAWKVHRLAFPESPLRNRIVLLWLLCFVTIIPTLWCMAYADVPLRLGAH